MFKKVMVIVMMMVMVMSTTTFAAENSDNEDSKAWYEVVTDTVVSGLDTAKTAVCDTASTIGDTCVSAGKGIVKWIYIGANVVQGRAGILMMRAGKGIAKCGLVTTCDAVNCIEKAKAKEE
jgi:hypothetical protein